MFAPDQDWMSPGSARSHFSQFEGDADKAVATLFLSASRAKLINAGGFVVDIEDDMLHRVLSSSPFRHAYFNHRTGEIGRGGLGVLDTLWCGFILFRQGKFSWFFTRSNIALLTVLSLLTVFIMGISKGVVLKSAAEISTVIPISTGVVLTIFKTMLTLLPIGFVAFLLWLIRRRDRRDCLPYIGAHIVFSRKLVESFTRSYYGQEVSTDEAPTLSDADAEFVFSEETEAAFEIVREQDRLEALGDKVKKEDAKGKFVAKLGVNGFERAWAEARRLRPTLGLGGRPKNNHDTL